MFTHSTHSFNSHSANHLKHHKEEVFDPDDVATSSPAPAALPQFDHADDDLMDVE